MMKSRSGFTLLELLAVRTTMMLARQQAVTKRQNVSVEFYYNGDGDGANDNWMLVVQGTARATNSIVYLPRGVRFNPAPGAIPFTPSGGTGSGGTTTINLKEKTGVGKSPQSKTVTVWLLTGVAEET